MVLCELWSPEVVGLVGLAVLVGPAVLVGLVGLSGLAALVEVEPPVGVGLGVVAGEARATVGATVVNSVAVMRAVRSDVCPCLPVRMNTFREWDALILLGGLPGRITRW